MDTISDLSMASRSRSYASFKWMVIMESIIQVSVFILIVFGWYLCTFHIGVDWLIRRQTSYVLGCLYLICVNTLIPFATGLYLYLCSGRQTHDVALYPMPDKASLTEPYPCANMVGGLEVCNKGECNGKWKPPRAHHCSTCGVCRLDFDHHCPWVGNCVTLSNLKAFLLLIYLVPLTFLISVVPVVKIFTGHALLALKISRQDEWATTVWWNWWGSWIFCAGPLGRWVAGTVLGFVVMKNNCQRDFRSQPGHLIEEPHLRVILTVGVAFLLSVFAIGLAITSTIRILQGVTTFETLRLPTTKRLDGSNGHLVCIPQATTRQILVIPVLPTERMYDLGPSCNWDSLMVKRHLLSGSTPSLYVWPKLNPTMMKRMRSLERNDQRSLI